MNRKFKKLLIGEWSFKRLFRSIIFIYLSLALYGFFFADNLIFVPQSSSYQDNEQIIKLTGSNQVKISAIYLPNPKAKYTILYAHGNAEDLGNIEYILNQLNQLDFNVFAYDYQGYGTSEGKSTEKNAYLDINTAYNYLTETLQIKPENIIVYGRSVGGGSAIDLASRKKVGGLIIESTFTTAFRVVIPIPIFPFEKFDNLQKIKRVNCPILVIHGTVDQVIPFKHGQQLFNQANEPKIYFWVENADHNNVVEIAGKSYAKNLKEFEKLINNESKITNYE